MAKVVVDIIAGNGTIRGKRVAISRGKKGGVLFSVAWKLYKECQVTGVEWKEQTQRSAGKAAVGAVAGSLLAGPVGLMIGGAFGARRRDASAAVIHFQDMQPLHVRATAKEFEFIQALL